MQTPLSEILRPRLTSFSLLVVSTAVAFSVLVLILSSLGSSLPEVGSETAIFRSSNSDRIRSFFLGQEERAYQQELAKEVHFLSHVISRNSRKMRTAAEAKRLATLIVQESRAANYDPLFVASVVNSESSFRSWVRSHKGALGLMQILPATGRYVAEMSNLNWNGSRKLTEDARYNLRLGIAYLKYLEEKFDGDMEKVLAAYNWGPTNVIRAKRSAPPRSVRNYASTILSNYSSWKGRLEQESQRYEYMNVNFVPSGEKVNTLS